MAPATSTSLSRVAVRYQGTQKDLVLPSRMPIEGFISDVLDALAGDTDTEIAAARDGHWTLARMDAALQPHHSLDDARVLDGSVLELRWVASTERYRPVIEDVVDAVSEAASAAARPFDEAAARLAGLGALITGGVALCVGQWALWAVNGYSWPWLLVGLLGAVVALVGMTSAALRYQAPDAATAWSVIWVVAAAGLGQVIPVSQRTHTPGVAHLLIAAIGVAAAAVCALLIVRRHLATYSAITAAASSLAVVCAVVEYTDMAPAAVAAGALLVGLVGLLQVPRTALVLARITVPPVPAPGQEDLDVGSGVSFDELATVRTRSSRAVQLTSGLMVATVAAVAVAAGALLDPHSYYIKQMIAINVCVVLVLVIRGRTMPNRIQAFAMFAGAAAVIIVSAATLLAAAPSGTTAIVVMVTVAAITTVLVLIAIAAAPRSVNPRIGRWVQWLGNGAMGLAFPLCIWVMGIYAAIRDMSLG